MKKIIKKMFFVWNEDKEQEFRRNGFKRLHID